MRDEFARYLTTRYSSIKTTFPGKGRRQWLLLALQEFWRNPFFITAQNLTPQMDIEHILEDDDPLDHIAETGELGILVRTDFSNEDAWNAFTTRLADSEKDLSESLRVSSNEDSQSSAPPAADADGGSISESEEDHPPDHVIKAVDPATEQERTIVAGISNITALRLFNDVDIRPAPSRPVGVKRTNTPHPLVDSNGWQEIYTGPDIWIYDSLSNTDGCARAVSQQSDFYGTATGDSWRARASHLPELQFNKICLGMKIDFGGLDRWDANERRRNLAEPYPTKLGDLA
ncbi:hypothetical protein BDN72DRAFT_885807 [Pluteus cervinus]|uniref:Uncharacterized protein n=1 Tax=Pluteus cervinus TaxID=181527 RepID=A0ACD3BB24_9AGAR|nr:hypothetical protein BDN72DRAFT_885807 [Pluteus cervinus]